VNSTVARLVDRHHSIRNVYFLKIVALTYSAFLNHSHAWVMARLCNNLWKELK